MSYTESIYPFGSYTGLEHTDLGGGAHRWVATLYAGEDNPKEFFTAQKGDASAGAQILNMLFNSIQMTLGRTVRGAMSGGVIGNEFDESVAMNVGRNEVQRVTITGGPTGELTR